MDPISAAVLAALAGGVGTEAGRQAWTGLSELLRLPFRRGDTDDSLVVSSGEDELAALAEAPGELERAQRLSTALAVRAVIDADFRLALEEWRRTARPEEIGRNGVTNHISGGTHYGPVLMGRDFFGPSVTTRDSAEPGTRGADTRADTPSYGEPPSPGADDDPRRE
ncbi:hypothetical protein OG599_24015 [Streptomyces sp. NBC_01335]|uniref:hypothetical protein n=1 Tax=Streptomyces sp. NBC_01335 TaxID=2903828 RepID=UPI002E0EF086|nr:hypothetical protein OG599_24015 [Streptomyces sp. NBC_01335]